MPDEERKQFPPLPRIPSHYEESSIVVPVPSGTQKRDIEQRIHDALAEQPEDIFKDRKSREMVIVLQHMGVRPPKEP
jgi:hypothetical protein